MEPKMAKIGQYSGRPKTAKKLLFKTPSHVPRHQVQHGNSYELSAALFLLFYFFLSLVLSHFAFHPEFSFLTISGNKLSDEGDQTMKGGRQGQGRDWKKKSEKYNKRGGEGVRIESENENIKTGKKRHRKKHRELLS